MGYWHARAITRAGGKVVAVCDLDLTAARRLASSCRVDRIASSLGDLIRDDGISVLHICTPIETHFELAATAIAQGLHVVVEKPLTPGAREAEDLYDLAEQHRVLLCPVHQFMFQPGVHQALSELENIGELRHLEMTFCSAGGVGRAADGLDEIVAEILPHPLSLMQLFVPGSLGEQGWSVNRSAVGEFRATLTAGSVGFSILVSMQSRPTTSALRLLGTAGTIHVDLFHGFCVVEPGNVSRWRKIAHPFDLSARTLLTAGRNLAARAAAAEPAYPGLRALIRSFYAAIAGGTESPIARGDVVAVARARDFLAQSKQAVSAR